jgi:hypothetical protein
VDLALNVENSRAAGNVRETFHTFQTNFRERNNSSELADRDFRDFINQLCTERIVALLIALPRNCGEDNNGKGGNAIRTHDTVERRHQDHL